MKCWCTDCFEKRFGFFAPLLNWVWGPIRRRHLARSKPLAEALGKAMKGRRLFVERSSGKVGFLGAVACMWEGPLKGAPVRVAFWVPELVVAGFPPVPVPRMLMAGEMRPALASEIEEAQQLWRVE